MKVDAIALTRDVDAQWKSVNVDEVNGSKVRVRVVQDTTARWHYHGTSHELFYVIAGRVFIDFDSSTEELQRFAPTCARSDSLPNETEQE